MADHSDQRIVERDSRRAELLEYLSRLCYEADVDDGTDYSEGQTYAFAIGVTTLLEVFQQRWKIKATPGYELPSFGSEEWNK